ncbi:hypothetical protein D4764_10G0005240 [Takifugu flavidus]|uniref:Uncharacterized protein n=1 Tax=Takifugu flavidus TaxID=433684 RepID=A0A5C6PI74_9TELE|nr:hypothetical protein D4764_10G0005240 [Takifugu flavidus]
MSAGEGLDEAAKDAADIAAFFKSGGSICQALLFKGAASRSKSRRAKPPCPITSPPPHSVISCHYSVLLTRDPERHSVSLLSHVSWSK